MAVRVGVASGRLHSSHRVFPFRPNRLGQPDASLPKSRVLKIARAGLSVALGVATACAAVELGLRAFASPQGPPTPNIAADSLGEDTLVRRQLFEGVSVARFSSAGARLTGNPWIPTAPTVVLLGDSYVVGAAVGDRQTMGSLLERNARREGVSVNVRQYGWIGASPSRYLLVGDAVLQRWNPAEVIIAISDNDLDGRALYESTPGLRVNASGGLEILPEPAVPVLGAPRRSALGALLFARTWLIQWRRSRAVVASRAAPIPVTPENASAILPDSLQLALLPRAVVHALVAKFGSRLALVYLAEVGVEGDDTASTIERRLFAACELEQVRCATTRPSMLAARRAGVIAHGFFNTTPGNGHLNPAGNAMAGAEIWKLVRRPPIRMIANKAR